MRKPIIAVDGPAGAGKSTVAKKIALKMGLLYIDSGAMFRSLALKAMKSGIDFKDEARIAQMAGNTKIELRPRVGETYALEVLLDGRDVTSEIRTEAVSKGASVLAVVPEVRRILCAMQREMGAGGGVAMEGRDIGTAVFPSADYKFYLDASVNERAKRRYKELKQKGENADIKIIEEEIRARDERDKSREIAPLRKADDAIVIDSTSMSIDEVVAAMLEKIDKSSKVKISWLFYLGRFIFYICFLSVWRCKITGHENIPRKGGVIIAPNHISYADPPLVGSAMRRPLHFMAKKELFEIPVLGYLISRVNSFPVRRGQQDMSAFRKALKLLNSGQPLLIFPEGTRGREGKFLNAKAGLGMIACLSQSPVVPVRIRNSDKLLKFAGISISFGKPLMPPKEHSRQAYHEFSQRVLEEIKKL